MKKQKFNKNEIIKNPVQLLITELITYIHLLWYNMITCKGCLFKRVVFTGSIPFSEQIWLAVVTWFMHSLAWHFIMSELTLEQFLQIV